MTRILTRGACALMIAIVPYSPRVASANYKCWLPGTSGEGRPIEEKKGTELPDPEEKVSAATTALSKEDINNQYTWIGKLSIQGREKANGAAVFIEKDLLITVAHNIYYNAKIATELRFTPKYSAVAPTRDDFKVAKAAYPSEWERYSTSKNAEAVALDYAILVTERELKDGKTVEIGSPPKQGEQFSIISYATIKGNEWTLARQRPTLFSISDVIYSAAPNGFDPGASGGAWMTDSGERGVVKKLFSVFSHAANFSPQGPMHGPVLNEQKVQELIKFARACGTPSRQ